MLGARTFQTIQISNYVALSIPTFTLSMLSRNCFVYKFSHLFQHLLIAKIINLSDK